MTTALQTILDQAATLPETDQNQLAHEIDERILSMKAARGEADIAAGRVHDATQVFAKLL